MLICQKMIFHQQLVFSTLWNKYLERLVIELSAVSMGGENLATKRLHRSLFMIPLKSPKQRRLGPQLFPSDPTKFWSTFFSQLYSAWLKHAWCSWSTYLLSFLLDQKWPFPGLFLSKEEISWNVIWWNPTSAWPEPMMTWLRAEWCRFHFGH